MKSKILIGVMLAAFSMGQTSAATIFTSRAAFLAATTGQVTDTFEENGSGGFTSHGTTYNGGTFTVTSTSLYTVDPDFDSIYQWNSGDVLDFEFGSGSISVAPGITALGFDFGNPDFFPGTGSVTINGVNYALLGQPNFNFWGIVDANPLSSINWNGGLGIMDNVTTGFGGAGGIPEPSVWAMLLLGFFAAGSGMRSRTARKNLQLSYS